MIISTARVTLARLIQGFGLGFIITNDWFLQTTQDDFSISGPDPSRGLIYPCYPKNVAWYYSDVSIVRSWDFLAFVLIMLVASTLSMGITLGQKTTFMGLKAKVPYADPFGISVPCALCGVVLGYAFSNFLEPSFINWLMTLGFRPPAISCFPLFAG